MLQRLCTYVKSNGTLCRMLALKENDLCRVHFQDKQQQQNFRSALARRRTEMSRHAVGNTSICKLPGHAEIFDDASAGLFNSLQLPPLEDANAIQDALTVLVRAIGTQQIPARNAGLILYALQIASGNQRRMRRPITPIDTISTDAPPPLPDPMDTP